MWGCIAGTSPRGDRGRDPGLRGRGDPGAGARFFFWLQHKCPIYNLATFFLVGYVHISCIFGRSMEDLYVTQVRQRERNQCRTRQN